MKKLSAYSLGLALAGLLGNGAARAQQPATNAAEQDNPHSPDNAKRPANAAPGADNKATARTAEEANVHSVDNKDRPTMPGSGSNATGDEQKDNPHSVKNKDLPGKKHHKAGDATPMAKPANADTK